MSNPTIGTYEDVGDTAPVCDVCGDIGWTKRDGDDCTACIHTSEASDDE